MPHCIDTTIGQLLSPIKNLSAWQSLQVTPFIQGRDFILVLEKVT